MEELLNVLVEYAKLQKGYEDLAENAKRLEQWEFYDEHIISAQVQKEKINKIKSEILKFVPNEN